MKKVLSIILTLVMLMNIVPVAAMAEGTDTITVSFAVASYDKSTNEFSLLGDVADVEMTDDGNVTVIDAMDEAVLQNKLSYVMEDGTWGPFVSSVNGKEVVSPDGWMFYINDEMSMVGAGDAVVTDGAKVLWYEGTVENNYTGPSWSEIAPTPAPTLEPTNEPTLEPTSEPTLEPTLEPTAVPTVSPELIAEADKYQDTYVVSLDSELNVSLPMIKIGEEESDVVSKVYSVESEYLVGGADLKLAKHNDTFATKRISVRIDFTDLQSNTYSKDVTVILPVTESKIDSFLDILASSYTQSTERWAGMDMMLYSSLPGKTMVLSDDAKQAIISDIIRTTTADGTDISYRASAEIILRSFGIDTTKLYPVNSATFVNNAELLSQMDLGGNGHYGAPWILNALAQGNMTLTDLQIDSLITMLKDNLYDGLFGYQWGGVTYPDPDTAGIAMSALAQYYDMKADAKYIIDASLSAYAGAMDANGSFGSANTDAVIIIGLIAMGIDPYTIRNENGVSVVDGMMSYVNCETNAFQFYGQDNALATEQAFRALIALKMFTGEKLNIYDFSDNEVVPGRATDSIVTATPPSVPDGGGNVSRIRVTITIKSDTSVWLNKTTISLTEGSTVYHALTHVADANAITLVGASNGYVRSMSKGGITLAEFDKGPNSGWIYEVNGEQPQVALTNCVLESGDDIVWIYSTDWTLSGSSSGSGSKPGLSTDEPAITTTPAPTKVPDPEKSEPAFNDIKGHWAQENINKVSSLGIMTGVSEDEFAPDATLTRAMLVTMLYRLEGSPDIGGNSEMSMPFKDVDKDSWYYNALIWAYSYGVVSGINSMEFAPNAQISREDLTVILHRYAKYKKYDVSVEGELDFKDKDAVSTYAYDSVLWASANKIVTGREDNTFDPKGYATRAEVATMLVRFIENVVR